MPNRVEAASPTACDSDLSFMREALALAEKASTRGEVPVGALITRGSKIIGRAYNLREATQDPTSHAELQAIREASRHLSSWRLNECTLYVTLEPCIMCAGAIHQARIPRVVYGCDNPKAGALSSLYRLASDERLNHCYSVSTQVMAAESRELLQSFFRAARIQKKQKT